MESAEVARKATSGRETKLVAVYESNVLIETGVFMRQ